MKKQYSTKKTKIPREWYRWGMAALIIILTAVNVGFGSINLSKAIRGLNPEVVYVTKEVIRTVEVPASEEPSKGAEPESPFSEDRRYETVMAFDPAGIVRGTAAPYAAIFREAEASSETVGLAFPNAVFRITGEKNGFYEILIDGYPGFIQKEFAAAGDTAMMLALSCCEERIRPHYDGVKVLRSPEEDAELIGYTGTGSNEPIENYLGDWLQVDYFGEKGFVKRDEVDIRFSLPSAYIYPYTDGLNPLRKQVVDYALKWLGGDYVWGGTTLGKGVDCSAYVMRIYEKFGINLPRTSMEQSIAGTKVKDPKELLPGDLVFCVGAHDGQPKKDIGHVAMYIGNGWIVHSASEERGITLDKLSYIPEILAMRRIIQP